MGRGRRAGNSLIRGVQGAQQRSLVLICSFTLHEARSKGERIRSHCVWWCGNGEIEAEAADDGLETSTPFGSQVA